MSTVNASRTATISDLLHVADVLAVDLNRQGHVAANHDPVEVVTDQHVVLPGPSAQRLRREARHRPRSHLDRRHDVEAAFERCAGDESQAERAG